MPMENDDKTKPPSFNSVHPAFKGSHTFYRPYPVIPQEPFNPSTVNPMFYGYYSQSLPQVPNKL